MQPVTTEKVVVKKAAWKTTKSHSLSVTVERMRCIEEQQPNAKKKYRLIFFGDGKV